MGENNKLTSEKIRLLTREQLGLLIRGELFMHTGLEENDIHHLLSNNNGVSTGAAGEGCTKAFSCFCKRLLEVTMEDKSLHKGLTDKQKKKSLKSTFMKQKVEIETEIRDFIKEQQNQGGGAEATAATTPVEQTEKSQISNDDELPLSEMKKKKDKADNDDESSCASDAGTTKSRDKDKRVGRKKKSKKEKKKRKKKSKLHEDDTMHGEDIGESNGIVPAAASTHVAYDGDSPTLGEDQLEQMRLAKEQFEKEKQKRISSMPKENVKGFRKIGFGKWGKTSLPIIQLSPYDVEDGDVRAAYFKMLEKTKVNKRTPTRLVFWYGCTWENRSEAYSFLSPNKILDYEMGKKEGLDKLSPVVEKKLAQGKPLTNKEDSFVQALTQMKNDLDLPPEKRIAWMIQFKESYETMFDQDSDIEMDVDIEQEEAIKNKKKPKKRGRKPKLKTNRTIHSDSEDELEGKNNTKAEMVAEKPKQKPPGKKRGRKSNAEKEAERLAEIARQEAEAAAIAAEAKNASPSEPVFRSTASDSDVSMPSSDDEDDDDYIDGSGSNKKGTSKKKKQKLKSAAVDSSSPKKKKKRKMKHTAEGEEIEKISKGKKRKSKASESGNELAGTTPTSTEKKSKKKSLKRIKVEQNNDSSSSSSDDADMESYDEKEHAVEQLRFEECEKEVSPILKEINIVVDQDDQEKLIVLFRNLKSKLNIITNAYMENTDMPAIIKKVSKRYKHSSSDVVEIVKDCRSELKTRYQNGSVPKGFKPKKKKVPINTGDSQENNPIDHVTTKTEQPSSNGGEVSISVPTSSKIVSNPNSPTEKNKVTAEDEKNPMNNYSFTIPTKNGASDKEKQASQQQRSAQSPAPLTPAPSAIKAQQQAAQKKPKKFSLTNLISGPSKPAPTEQVKEPHQTTSAPSKPLSSIQPKTKSTQIPKWLTTSSESSSSSSSPNMISPTSTESDEDRSFAFDYLCDALQNSAIQTTTSSSTIISPQASTPPTVAAANKINVKAGARVLEDAIYRFSSNKNSDFYWEKVHDVCTFFRGGAHGRSSAKMMDQLSDPASFIKLSRSAMLEEIMDSS